MMVGLAALDPPYVLKRNWRCGNGLWRLARGRASVQSVLLASSPERNKNTITLQGPQAPYFTQPRVCLTNPRSGTSGLVCQAQPDLRGCTLAQPRLPV